MATASFNPVFHQMWDKSFDAIRVTDAEGTVRLANDAYCRLVGRSREALVGQPFWIVHPEREWHERQQLHAASFARNVAQGFVEREATFWDGRQVWLEISNAVVEMEPGVSALLTILRDISKRKAAELRGATQNAWHEQLFVNMSLAIVMLDERECVRSVNPMFVEMFGYSEEELRGRIIDEFIVPPSRREEALALSQHTLSGGIVEKETERQRRDGSLVRVRTLGIPIRVEGRLVGIYGVYEDITRRKTAEEALRSSETRYRSLIERMQDGVYRSTADGRFLEVNPSMVRMFGFASRDEMLAIDIPKTLYFEPGDRGSAGSDATGVQTDTFRMRRKDGSEIWVEDHGSYVRDESGRILFHEGILRDVTQRKRYEDALRQSEERFRALVQNAQDVITIHNTRGIIVYTTDSSLSVLGYQPDELVGRSAFEFIHPDDLQVIATEFRSLEHEQNSGVPSQYRFRHANGSWIILESLGRNLLSHPGIQGLVVTSRDVTQRKLAEEAIRESESRFRAVVEQSGDGIYLIDVLTLGVVHCNAAFCQMLGYTIDEALQLSAFNIIADDLSEINRRISSTLTESHPSVDEHLYRTKGGSTIDVLASKSVISYGGKRVICAIVRDITERKKLERDREVLIKELQTALSNIRTLGGLIPICSNCKKIRDDKGYWNHLEKYLAEHSDATLSHGICPDCARKLYPEVFDK